ncbi:MAG: MipA/OmpV family protein [Pseudomonadota bacterium]
MHLRSVWALAALLAGAACAADAPFLMPEHSREFVVGAALVYQDEEEGSARRSAFLRPHFEGEWSNGVFLQGLWLGKQLSTVPHLRYGPLLSFGRDRVSAHGGHGSPRPLVGAFWEYQVLHNLSIRARGHRMAGGGNGGLLDLQLASFNSVAPHHALGLAAGLRLADRRYLQANFDAGKDASGGVKDVYLKGVWLWELNPKYTASMTLESRRLEGSAATSPWVARRRSLASSVMLTYRY